MKLKFRRICLMASLTFILFFSANLFAQEEYIPGSACAVQYESRLETRMHACELGTLVPGEGHNQVLLAIDQAGPTSQPSTFTCQVHNVGFDQYFHMPVTSTLQDFTGEESPSVFYSQHLTEPGFHFAAWEWEKDLPKLAYGFSVLLCAEAPVREDYQGFEIVGIYKLRT